MLKVIDMSNKYTWTTADEVDFIQQLPKLCKKNGIDLFLCISNYLGCVDSRRWDSRFIDIDRIKNAAKSMQEYSITIRTLDFCNDGV